MKKLRTAGLLLGFALVGTLHAQPAPDQPATDTAAPAPAATPTSQLSAEEMTRQVGTFQAGAKDDANAIAYLQAQARKEQDVIKLSCVNDIAIKVKAEQNMLDDQATRLENVIETDERFGAFSDAQGTSDRIRKLREQAAGCAGEPELTGEFANSVSAPEIPDDPTTGVPFDDQGIGTVIEPPGYASPYN